MSIDYDKPYYNKLYFDSIDFLNIETGVSPHFTCPNCKKTWYPSKIKPAVMTETIDFNQRVVFKCPNCGVEIRLYIGLYKDSSAESVCISVEPLPAGWWKKTI